MKKFATLLMLLTISMFSVGCDNAADDTDPVDGDGAVTDTDTGGMDTDTAADVDAGAATDTDDASGAG